MHVIIKNLTNRPVLLRLNSGQTLHLAPLKTSAEVMEVEVKDNPKVEKLEERHIISLQDEKGHVIRLKETEQKKHPSTKTGKTKEQANTGGKQQSKVKGEK